VQEKYNKKNKGLKKNQGKNRFFNQCRHCDDNHEWFDCLKYNKNSKTCKEKEKSTKEDHEHNYMSANDNQEIEYRDYFKAE